MSTIETMLAALGIIETAVVAFLFVTLHNHDAKFKRIQDDMRDKAFNWEINQLSGSHKDLLASVEALKKYLGVKEYTMKAEVVMRTEKEKGETK